MRLKHAPESSLCILHRLLKAPAILVADAQVLPAACTQECIIVSSITLT